MWRLALTSFAARVALVDTVQASASADDDISRFLNFYGCTYLHLSGFFS